MCKSCPISNIQNEVINADNSQNSRLTSNLPLIQARIFSYGATSGCIEGGSGFCNGKDPKVLHIQAATRHSTFNGGNLGKQNKMTTKKLFSFGIYMNT